MSMYWSRRILAEISRCSRPCYTAASHANTVPHRRAPIALIGRRGPTNVARPGAVSIAQDCKWRWFKTNQERNDDRRNGWAIELCRLGYDLGSARCHSCHCAGWGFKDTGWRHVNYNAVVGWGRRSPWRCCRNGWVDGKLPVQCTPLSCVCDYHWNRQRINPSLHVVD